jgi:glycosyltransferase involved in cell wall biosynthesis
MNIGIDARLLERRITGIGRVLELLLDEIPHFDKENRYYLFTYRPIKCNNYYTNVSTIGNIIPQKIFSPIWNNLILPFYLKRHKIDILLSINQVVPLLKLSRCKYISVVHDVIFRKDKNFLPPVYRYYLTLFSYFSLRISDVIITVSEFSKQDIMQHYNVDEKKIRVVPLSVSRKFYPLHLSEEEKRKVKESLQLFQYVVLYVGMIENRKNIQGILNVADEMIKCRSDVQFLLIGNKGYGSDKLIPEIEKRENVKYISKVDDYVLNRIYNISDIFILPSLYEGFGIPALEAMQCGLPVIASNRTSIKEIVGDGGLFRDPYDYKGIAEDIEKLIENKEFYMTVQTKALDRAQSFSKERMVNEFISIFNALGKQQW